ncbi:hypothetical protein QQF64_031705 [Cirrhinus molitorella]|uniref:Uncharacterized protein n=1 Tax=Cirrhinus molitorella TaxID=172907 RepID=A0ABR3MXU8_9TELE
MFLAIFDPAHVFRLCFSVVKQSFSSSDQSGTPPAHEGCRVASGSRGSFRSRSGPVFGGTWRVPATGKPRPARARADISFQSSRARSTDLPHNRESARTGTSRALQAKNCHEDQEGR